MNSRSAAVFTVEERNGIRDRILEIAKCDERIIAGAVVGSPATDNFERAALLPAKVLDKRPHCRHKTLGNKHGL
jgi:hypothetical protein